MSEETRKSQMKKVPQLEVVGIDKKKVLKSKRYSKSNGYSMKKGQWNS